MSTTKTTPVPGTIFHQAQELRHRSPFQSFIVCANPDSLSRVFLRQSRKFHKEPQQTHCHKAHKRARKRKLTNAGRAFRNPRPQTAKGPRSPLRGALAALRYIAFLFNKRSEWRRAAERRHDQIDRNGNHANDFLPRCTLLRMLRNTCDVFHFSMPPLNRHRIRHSATLQKKKICCFCK